MVTIKLKFMVEASSEKIETNVEEVKIQPNGNVKMEEV